MRKRKNGLLLGIGGLVCSGVAVSMAVREADGSDLESGWAIGAGACLVLSYVGVFIAVSAVTDQLDAINIYNDDAARAFTPSLPPGVDVAPHRRGGPPGQ